VDRSSARRGGSVKARSVAPVAGAWVERVAALGRRPIPEGALAVALVFTLFLGSCRNPLPIGYGAYYILMADAIRHHAFALPLVVPFYGPGGTPFAYPPLALYLMALATGPLHESPFFFVRFFPPFCSVLLGIAIYLLAIRLNGGRWPAMAAVALTMSNETIIAYHATTAGAVRAPAFVFAVFGLLATLLALEGGKRRHVALVGAAALFGLTLLTHLTYAMFFALGVACMVAFPPATVKRGWCARVLVAGAIGVGGTALASPWWVTVAARWGLATFIGAAATHGGFGLATTTWFHDHVALRIVSAITGLGRDWRPAVLAGLAVAGLGSLAARGRWLLPAWFVVLLFGLGESDRFLVLIGAMAAGELLAVLAGSAARPAADRGLRMIAGAVPGFVVCGLALSAASLAQFAVRSALTPALLDAAEWIRNRTPATSRYADLSASHDVGEWLPFLTHRRPVICPWGAEWTGSYARQFELFHANEACVRREDAACVAGVMRRSGVTADLLVLRASANPLRRDFTASGGWIERYANAEYVVLSRTSAGPGSGTDETRRP
jgi:hypothetical protein